MVEEPKKSTFFSKDPFYLCNSLRSKVQEKQGGFDTIRFDEIDSTIDNLTENKRITPTKHKNFKFTLNLS